LVAEPFCQGGYGIEIICKEANRDHILLNQVRVMGLVIRPYPFQTHWF
jgi:hypothetical protein